MFIFKCLIILFFCLNENVVAILDITLVIPTPIVSHQEDTVLQCVSDNSNFTPSKFPFSIVTDVGTGTKMTYDRIYGNIEPEPWPGKQVKFLEKAGPFKYGIFACTVGLDNEETTSVGIIMSKNARLFPVKLNYRSSSNESVKMSVMQLRPAPYADVSWYQLQNSSSPPTRMGAATLSLDVVAEPEIAGTYLIFHQTNNNIRRVYQQGITRLIVRNCVWGKYSEDCSGQCPLCENGGICHDFEGVCICPPGFKGPLCETICDKNKFGADCQHSCSEDEDVGCRGKLFCLPDPYGCSCASGYYGIICSYKCGAGKYGANCDQECHCVENKCDGFNGTCTHGCKKGWTGPNCQQSCPDFTYGADCVHTCGSCMFGACDHVSGHCKGHNATDADNSTEEAESIVCKLGFLPPYCKEPCEVGTWGTDCKLNCYCYNNVTCDIKSGLCEERENSENCAPGWQGISCNETCNKGFYGENCSKDCGFCLNATFCEPILGNCIENEGICEPGYIPTMCDTPCEPGFFGLNCTTECNCANGTSCNRVLGSCDGYCQPGFTGENCWHPCSYGTYGLNCSSKCGNCKMVDSGPSCEPAFGTCTDGCKKSWSGDFCLTGILCYQNPCLNDGECSQTEDIYSCECFPGYSGAHCEIINPPCDSTPCINNSTCIEQDTTYSCSCAVNYTGQNCEINIKDEVVHSTTITPTTTMIVTTNKNELKQEETTLLYIILCVIGASLLVLGLSSLLFLLKRKKKGNKIGQKIEDIPSESRISSPESTYSRQSNRIATPKPSKNDFINNEKESLNESVNKENKVPTSTDKPIKNKLSAPPSPNTERISFEKTNANNDPIAHVSPLTKQPMEGDVVSPFEPKAIPNESTPTKPTETELKRPNSAKKVLFSAPEPPSGPTDIQKSPEKDDTAPKRMSKPKIRFNANALERLSEISLHNFYNKRKSSISRPSLDGAIDEESPSKDPRQSVASVGGCALTSWDLKPRQPCVYGISKRDSMLMVTKPRDASEDFEMESRRGSRTVGRESMYNTAL